MVGKRGVTLTVACLITALAVPALGNISEADQYRDILYEKYLESLEKARAEYLLLLKTAQDMNETRSQWIDLACNRVIAINKILGDMKDPQNCVEPEPR